MTRISTANTERLFGSVVMRGLVVMVIAASGCASPVLTGSPSSVPVGDAAPSTTGSSEPSLTPRAADSSYIPGPRVREVPVLVSGVDVTVVDEDGSPVPRCVVVPHAISLDPGEYPPEDGEKAPVTDENGSVGVGLPPGTWRIGVYCDDIEYRVEREIRVDDETFVDFPVRIP